MCSPCPFGFDGNGYNGCQLIDQCRNTTGVAHNCTAVAACSLLSPGVYTCTCPLGYVGDGFEIGTGIAHSGCTDVAAPVLTCPDLIVVQAWPDAPQAWVTVQLQEARDNSGAAPSISATRIFDEVATSIVVDEPQQFPVGTSGISVVAQDADSNTAGCIGEVEVQPIVSVTVPTRMHYLYEGRSSSVVVYMYHLGSAPEANTTVVEVLANAADAAQDFLHLDSPRATFTQSNWSTWVTMRVRVYDNMVDQGDRYSAEVYHTTTSLDVVSCPPPPNHYCHRKLALLTPLRIRSATDARQSHFAASLHHRAGR